MGRSNNTRRGLLSGTRLTTALVLLLVAQALHALPESRRINSVKALTHTLSLVEKENGTEAQFVTMKLQIYLEDIYISQGTMVVLKPKRLSVAIHELLQAGKVRSQVAKTILRRYKDGEFHE